MSVAGRETRFYVDEGVLTISTEQDLASNVVTNVMTSKTSS